MYQYRDILFDYLIIIFKYPRRVEVYAILMTFVYGGTDMIVKSLKCVCFFV